MKIKQIHLRNKFKILKNLTLDLEGEYSKKLVALVGSNGSGKSSVFDIVMSYYCDITKIGTSGWINSSFGSKSIHNHIRQNVNIQFDSGDFDYVMQENRNKRTLFSFRSPYRSSILNLRNLDSQSSPEMNDKGAKSTVDFDDKLESNYYRVFMYIYNKLRKENLRYEEILNQFFGELNSLLQQSLGLKIVDIGNILQNDEKQLYFKKFNYSDRISYNALSSGEKEVVDLAIDILVNKDIYNDTIYIIDEPELHLNTSIQRRFLKGLVDMIDNNCQLWIATHSLGFMRAIQNDLAKESVVFNFDEIDLSKDEYTLKPMKLTRNNWQKVIKVALDDLTNLVAPERIICCEGKSGPGFNNQEEGLDAKIYNLIFEANYPETLFISNGCKNDLKHHSGIGLNIINKTFKDVEILRLSDRDDMNDGQMKTFLQEDKFRRTLKRREIENYLFDFEIISKAYPSLDKQKYDNIFINIDLRQDRVKQLFNKLSEICEATIGKNDFKFRLAKFITPDTYIYKELKECIFEQNLHQKEKF